MRRLIKILILVLILTACLNKDDELILKDDHLNTDNVKGNTEIYDQQDTNTNAIKEDNSEDKAPSTITNKNITHKEQENSIITDSKSKDLSVKNDEKNHTTYGDIEIIDEIIPYQTLDAKQDPNKDLDTTGILVKGQNGLRRKETRKVYVNGKYIHTEIVKDYFIVQNPIHEQHWIGTKETTPPAKETMTIDNELWILYKTFSSSDACIANIQSLQDQHFREWEGGSMCWGEHLYYSTGDEI